jgi:hypothetical protein
MIDLMIRCATRARWVALAQNRNLIDSTGRPNSDVSIDELGNVVITPAILNTSTFPATVVTPAVVDTWWMVNVRLSGAKFLEDADTLYTGEIDGPWKFIRSKLVRFIREQATQVTTPWGGRAYQFGTTTNRVQILDPRDAPHAPKREWLGGMSL